MLYDDLLTHITNNFMKTKKNNEKNYVLITNQCRSVEEFWKVNCRLIVQQLIVQQLNVVKAINCS